MSKVTRPPAIALDSIIKRRGTSITIRTMCFITRLKEAAKSTRLGVNISFISNREIMCSAIALSPVGT